MTTTVKGLLKGLRYISQIFDDEKEDEIQIGFPTDVKHVAHIGWDGQSGNAPTWMTELKAEPEHPPEAVKSNETTAENNNLKGGGIRNKKEIPKPKHHNTDSQVNSPTKRSSDGSRHAQRHRSSDLSADGAKNTRRNRNSNSGAESPSQDASAPPKQTRRRKAKTASMDGSVKSKSGSITDGDLSLQELGSGPENGHV